MSIAARIARLERKRHPLTPIEVATLWAGDGEFMVDLVTGAGLTRADFDQRRPDGLPIRILQGVDPGDL